MRPGDKDRAWNRYKQLKSFIKDNQVSNTELKRGGERDIARTMKEVEITNRASKELKRIGRILGEPTNINKFRR